MAYQWRTWLEQVGDGRRLQRRRRVADVLFVASMVVASLASSAQAAPPQLGTAEGFAVLAGSAVTNTGPSVISGDLGVSPGTAVTGFPPGTLSAGTVHRADAVALSAQSDLVTAYNDAAGRSSTATIAADLAGRTLGPGVYTAASSLGLSGDLTLDARGDPAAVFVFQAASTLNAGSASHVVLSGGAQACNVFWQVGSSASIGTGSSFVGNVLALTSISMTTGATLNGRALARNGAVTLDTNTIIKSACATQSGTSPPGSTPGGPTPPPGSTPGSPKTSSARLSGPSGCVRTAFRAIVSGRRIARVTFFADGKRRRTVKAKAGRNVFSLRVDPRTQNRGAHRITAIVHFTTDSATKDRTLRLVYQRCSKAALAPHFTG
ncbi:MAG: hypothetical protein QOC54_3866 [Baekduia sp.]|jgi:hypothetical protein|nr:hypothetical protein [Baekduia sp.]